MATARGAWLLKLRAWWRKGGVVIKIRGIFNKEAWLLKLGARLHKGAWLLKLESRLHKEAWLVKSRVYLHKGGVASVRGRARGGRGLPEGAALAPGGGGGLGEFWAYLGLF